MFEKIYVLLASVCFISATLSAGEMLPSPEIVQPGEIWPDDRRQHIQAHGGGIIKVGGTYYWFGEDRSQGNDPNKRFVACYASRDLVHWKFRNQVIKLADPENFGPSWVLERPKVYYNAASRKFVMYMHIDRDYALALVGVATCDTVDGDYKYLRSFRPLGKESRDIGQFIDDDGSAYLVFECRAEGGFYIAKLSADYLDVEKAVSFIKAPLEGGAIVHYQGLYYAIGSLLTGWDPNPNLFATSPSIAGPWSTFKDIAPPEKKTYGSQSSMMLKVAGTKTTSVIFMGDIWKPNTQWDSRYLWMPLEIGDGKLRLPEPRPWMIDVQTGEVAIKTGQQIKKPSKEFDRQKKAVAGAIDKLEILEAGYGLNGRVTDVRDTLKMKVIGDTLKVGVSPNEFGGADLAPGVTKILRVKAKYGEQQAIFRMSDMFGMTITPELVLENAISPKTKGLNIIKAEYGSETGRTDVTELIKEMAEEGTRKIPVSITLFGVDPAFGEVKSLTVTYTLNGKKSTDTVPENHVLELP